jgi:hypothetical protein
LTADGVGGDRQRLEPNYCVAASCQGARAQGESTIDKKKRPGGGRSLLFIGHALLDLIFDYWAY